MVVARLVADGSGAGVAVPGKGKGAVGVAVEVTRLTVGCAVGGGVAPALGLMQAAKQARERLAENQGSVTETAAQTTAQTTAPMRFDPSDLFDSSSGLHLVTTPGLSVKRR